ncbi:histone deacetylase family protein [Pseudomonas cavernicola]|uniref:acetylputrescine deacetylase n=1 Tax=Pseudomonas cavernicola TaxID=2320866 RepID=A0A418XJB6_9PSED|nr:histone deacetylase family protein [Pseudomonas cavernicola]RJG12531.1 histone deacetylase family protein [Pseudomonas cavernicola]
MLTIYSDDHHLHHGKHELIGGQFKPCFEMPSRADMVLDRAKAVALGNVQSPLDFGLAPIRRVHSEGFLRFLQNAWADWQAIGRSHDMLPIAWPTRRLRQVEPTDIDGRLGYYSFDAGAPITAGTWQAILSSANVALTGQAELAKGARGVFSLCRPPGHHAAADYMGGYCYLNNAAIAVQALLDLGAKRVAVLDVDYHHGNGTQDIFYDRADVLFTSIHGDPRFEYPYFLGFADEKGTGVGAGFNFNYPLAAGSDWSVWSLALADACRQIHEYAPDALVVSLGVDTFKADPISQFKLDSPDYLRMGEVIGKLGLQTLFVMEGGYAVEEIGINAVNVLQGFDSIA